MDNTKLVLALKRFAKVVGAAVIAAAIGWLSGPDVADVVGTQGQLVVTLILVPFLSGLEKGWFPKTS